MGTLSTSRRTLLVSPSFPQRKPRGRPFQGEKAKKLGVASSKTKPQTKSGAAPSNSRCRRGWGGLAVISHKNAKRLVTPPKARLIIGGLGAVSTTKQLQRTGTGRRWNSHSKSRRPEVGPWGKCHK